MKRISLAFISILGISSLSYAQNNAPSQFSGIYIGAEGGILNSLSSINSREYLSGVQFFSGVETSLDANLLHNAKTNHNFGAGVLSIGLGKVMYNNVYLGSELALNLAQRKNDSFVSSNNNKFSNQTQVQLNKAEFDLDFKGGLVFNSNLLTYLRLGAGFNRFKADSKSSVQLFTFPDFFESNNYAYSKKVTGFRLGAGAEYSITQNLVAKFDYVFTWFGSRNTTNSNKTIHRRDNGTFTLTFNDLSNNSLITMNTQTVMVGLSYYFKNL